MFHDAAETKTGCMALCPRRQRGPDRLSAHPRRLPPTPMQVPKPRVAFFSGEEDPDFVRWEGEREFVLTLASLSPELARKSALASSGVPYSCFVVEGCCTQSNRSGAKRGGERMCGTGSDDGILILFTADGWADRAVAQAWAAL